MFAAYGGHVMANPKTQAAIRALREKARERSAVASSPQPAANAQPPADPPSPLSRAARQEFRFRVMVAAAVERYRKHNEKLGAALTPAEFVEIDTGLDPAVAREFLAILADAPERTSEVRPSARPTMRRILERVMRVSGFSLVDMRGGRRRRDLVLARQMFCYWAIRLTGQSYPSVGRMICRDHTTVLHAVDAYVEKRAAKGRHLKRLRQVESISARRMREPRS